MKETYPDKAMAIWKKLAEEEIAQTKVKAYYTAATYLRKIHTVMKKEEWQAYLRELREANARKPRLVEILGSLSGKRIVDH